GVLIVLYVGTQLAASLVTAISADPMQRRIMLALPFVFVIFIVNFEAGLIVYWITTNVWTIGQQLLVKKLYPKPVPAAATADAGPAPARGKPPAAEPAGAAALTDGEPKADGKPEEKAPSGAKKQRKGKQKAAATTAGNGGSSKPPPSPRKKKKRSGRRR
ncbi:MAG: YidC/Oxa1 family membrane protein insertase, partial [Thermoleophilaceae bacterium]